MLPKLLPFLVCPVTRTELKPVIFSYSKKMYNGNENSIPWEGVLFAENDWFYPIIKGIPRLQVEAFLDHNNFLREKLPDYEVRSQNLFIKYGELIRLAENKNKLTKKSFEFEWNLFDYKEDKTWELKADDLLVRFLSETEETSDSLFGKLIFDAGCGNGILSQYIAKCGATIVGMDFSKSIERAFSQNHEENALFIQGDVQYPPLRIHQFDIVHCSGVLIHTNNTEYSLSCLDPCVKKGGKLSIWIYHPRKNLIHNFFNFLRGFTSKLPIKVQYYLYLFFFFPLSYLIKRLKGNKQNKREMIISIMDWFSPEFRWEHTYDEAKLWFLKRNYENVKITTTDTFGFNIIGTKS